MKRVDPAWKEEILDPQKPLSDYWGKIVIDESGSMAVVNRHWAGTLVRDKEPSYGQFGGTPSTFSDLEQMNKLGYSYHYENIVYGEGYFVPLKNKETFNSDHKLVIIGSLANEKS